MTILPPPKPEPRHECETPAPLRRVSSCSDAPTHPHGTLWECPVCGRWWKCRAPKGLGPVPAEAYFSGSPYSPAWHPVRWYDIPARRRIAAHETEKMHYRVPNILGDLHWWHCHPNPNRGRP